MAYTSSIGERPFTGQKLTIRFPQREQENVTQDCEQCEVIDGEKSTTVRFHDYALTYSIPGLYNQLFGGVDSETQCISPQVMAELLEQHLHLVLDSDASVGNDQQHKSLRVLDFGAGNGMIGEQVRLLASTYNNGSLAKSTSVIGLDILPEAKMAAERDRPGVYDAYIVADIMEYVQNLRAAEPETAVCLAGFNVLVSVSALSFGDASAAALKAAFSLVQNGGLILFNLKAGLLDDEVPTAEDTGTKDANPTKDGFSRLIQQAVAERRLEILAKKTYCHRFSVTGEPLYYVAVVAIKLMSLD